MSTPTNQVWKRLYNDVKIHIPGVTDVVYQQILFQVLNDFMDRTNIWFEEVPIAVEPNKLKYTFELQHKGFPNRLMLLYDPSINTPDKKWVQSGVSMLVPGIIDISYSPSTAATWNAVVAKVLNDPTDTENYPDIEAQDTWIIDKYGDGILYGVLGRLQSMPGKPFSNSKDGKGNWQVYIAERGKARTDAIKANVFGGQRWQFPQSFATVRRGGWA